MGFDRTFEFFADILLYSHTGTIRGSVQLRLKTILLYRYSK